MRAREYDPETGRFLEVDSVACDAACASVYVYADDQPTVLTDPSGMSAIGSGTCTACSGPKSFNVTFFSAGTFVIHPMGNGIWKAADKICGTNKGMPPGWRICNQAQLFKDEPWRKGKWGYEGSYGGSAGPNWVYDDTAPERSADLEATGISWCYLGALFASMGHGDWGVGKGYVYMAPSWVKHNSNKVPVTRYYAELYGYGVNDPSKTPTDFLSKYPSWAAPVVNVSEYVGKDQIAKNYVHEVCSSSRLKKGGWMGVWADNKGIDAARYKAIKEALDDCSLGK